MRATRAETTLAASIVDAATFGCVHAGAAVGATVGAGVGDGIAGGEGADDAVPLLAAPSPRGP